MSSVEATELCQEETDKQSRSLTCLMEKLVFQINDYSLMWDYSQGKVFA